MSIDTNAYKNIHPGIILKQNSKGQNHDRQNNSQQWGTIGPDQRRPGENTIKYTALNLNHNIHEARAGNFQKIFLGALDDVCNLFFHEVERTVDMARQRGSWRSSNFTQDGINTDSSSAKNSTRNLKLNQRYSSSISPVREDISFGNLPRNPSKDKIENCQFSIFQDAEPPDIPISALSSNFVLQRKDEEVQHQRDNDMDANIRISTQITPTPYSIIIRPDHSVLYTYQEEDASTRNCNEFLNKLEKAYAPLPEEGVSLDQLSTAYKPENSIEPIISTKVFNLGDLSTSASRVNHMVVLQQLTFSRSDSKMIISQNRMFGTTALKQNPDEQVERSYATGEDLDSGHDQTKSINQNQELFLDTTSPPFHKMRGFDQQTGNFDTMLNVI